MHEQTPSDLASSHNTEVTKRHNGITWGPLFAVFGTIFIYIFAQVLAVAAISLYFSLRGLSTDSAQQLLTDSTLWQIVFYATVQLMTLALLLVVLRNRKSTVRAIGLIRFKLHDMAYALSGFFVYILTFVSVIAVSKVLIPSLDTNQKQEIGFSTATRGPLLALIFVCLVILPPLVEELLTRGFLYSGLRKKLNMLGAGLITSLLFAAAHLQFGSGKPLLWVAGIDTFILSCVLVYLREKTGSLWAPMLLHGLKNSIAFISLFILKQG